MEHTSTCFAASLRSSSKDIWWGSSTIWIQHLITERFCHELKHWKQLKKKKKKNRTIILSHKKGIKKPLQKKIILLMKTSCLSSVYIYILYMFVYSQLNSFTGIFMVSHTNSIMLLLSHGTRTSTIYKPSLCTDASLDILQCGMGNPCLFELTSFNRGRVDWISLDATAWRYL